MSPTADDVARYVLSMLRECEAFCGDHPQLKTLHQLLRMTRLEAARICMPGKDLSTLFLDKAEDTRAKKRTSGKSPEAS